MNKVRQLLEESLTGGLYQMTLSGATGEATGCSKKKIRPVLLKDRLLFQITAYRGTQVFHENHTAEETAAILEADLSGSFKQLQVETTSFEATVLVSKKGKMTVRKKQRSVSEDNVKVSLSHNRKKRYILEEGRPVPFLVDLGVQTKEGKVITSRYDKFRQINRFLEFIEDIWPLLPKDRPVHIIDFGCGKSYLTFAMYYYLQYLHVKTKALHNDISSPARCNARSRLFSDQVPSLPVSVPLIHADNNTWQKSDKTYRSQSQ